MVYVNEAFEKEAYDEEEFRINPVELSDEDYLRIAKENRERRMKAAKRREGFRKARALLEAEDRETAL